MPRQQQQNIIPTETMIEESIEFIRQHEPEEGYSVGFSGGKDSIVTLELCKMAGVKIYPHYSATGIDPPELIKFINKNYPEIKHIRPKITFWKGVRKYSPPLRKMRWCCRLLKENRISGLPNMIFGIRSEESKKRADRGQISKKCKIIQLKPIFNWSEYHVWDFIEGNKLKYPILYDEGFHRIGCVICPFLCGKNQKHIDKHKKRWPAFYKTFEHVVTDWYINHRNEKQLEKNRINYPNETAKDYIEKWYRGFEE